VPALIADAGDPETRANSRHSSTCAPCRDHWRM